MGQRISTTKTDFEEKSDIIFEKMVAMISITPFYIFNGDQETNLSTGNNNLDVIVKNRISQSMPYLLDIFNKLDYCVIDSFNKDNIFYIAVENQNKTIFDIDNCKQIRHFFDDYNQSSDSQIIAINEKEAETSPFFEDNGDIYLGFSVGSIEYI